MRLVLFGDSTGLPQLARALRREQIGALVGAAIRPAQHGAIARLASALGTPFLVQPRWRTTDYDGFRARLQAIESDYFLVNSYSMLLRPDILTLPRLGAVNLHGALLPEQRGANPVEWAILCGERRSGASLHWMDAEFDRGDLIDRREVPIAFSDTWIDVRRKTRAAADRMISESLPKVLFGTAPRLPQDSAKAHSYRRRSAEDGRFTWSMPAIDIYNLVRALVAPHPGAMAEGRDGRDVVLRDWRSLPEIVWRKSEAVGGFTRGQRYWRLLAHRPSPARPRVVANHAVALGFCHLYDHRERATVVFSGIDDWRRARCDVLTGDRGKSLANEAWRAARAFAAQELHGVALDR
jgi:methionyl-tRNA formyltransferase